MNRGTYGAAGVSLNGTAEEIMVRVVAVTGERAGVEANRRVADPAETAAEGGTEAVLLRATGPGAGGRWADGRYDGTGTDAVTPEEAR